MAKSLYICYFGIREPLVQTQVIPYLRELTKGGHEISLLTFEPRSNAERRTRSAELRADEDGVRDEKAVREELAGAGVKWRSLRYHKRFSVLATAWDVLRGAVFIRRHIARENPDILHARVHVPMLMAAVARKFSRRKPKLLFDIRGFMPEEYTDAGLWPEGGWLYRTAKRVERWLMKEADGFVVLTEKARSILFPESRETGFDKKGRPVEVIPCCVDLSRFEIANEKNRAAIRAELGLDGRFVMAYVGAFGGWYLTRETADLFGTLKQIRPDAFALVLTQSSPQMIEPLLLDRGYEATDYLIKRVAAEEIPGYLSGADAGISFIKVCYSKQASSPTKNAEYLACGLPIIANSGIGDTDIHIKNNAVGTLVSGFSEQELAEAIDKVEKLGDVRAECARFAMENFDLENVGGVRYRGLYERILNK